MKRPKTTIRPSNPPVEGVDLNEIIKQSKDDTQLLRARSKKIKSKLPKDPVLYLPTRFEKISKQYPLEAFEEKYCQCKLTHQSSDISKPVLISTKAEGKSNQINLEKFCVQSFKIINSCEKKLENSIQLDELIKTSQYPIIDEIFAQLLMQSTTKTLTIWQLFLIVCTLYVPSIEITPYLKSYFSNVAQSEENEIRDLAILCFIRLTYITTIYPNIVSIPEESLSKKYKFGVSISEQMFNQRTEYPNLPIPHTLYRLVTLLQEKSCQSQEGIFRLNGNMKLIDSLADDLNNGEDTLENPEKNANLNDISSLLKKWIRDLPEPPIPFDKLKALEMDSKEDSLVDFNELLTRANHASLMFLTGFLQSLLNFSDFTKMNAHNFAICFAPAIVRPPPDETNPKRIHFISELGINYVENMILQWDTTPLFPLKNKFLE